MGSKYLILDDLWLTMEDAPSVTTAIAQHLFPITEIDANVNIRNTGSDAQTVNGGIFRNSEGFALNTGIADGFAGIAEDISHVLVEPEIVLADRNVRVASLKTSIAGRNTREADRNVRVARVKTCIADGNIRVADSNISAEDARLFGIEEIDNCFEAVAHVLGTSRDIEFMPTTCTFPSGVSRGTVESNLQAPVHSEHSGEDLASETCLSVTDVNITHTEETELCYDSSEDDKVNYETMEKLDLWNVFKKLTDEYLDECRVARVETCVDIFETDRVTGNASSRQKGISEQRLRYYHNDGINSYSEDSGEEYFDAQGANLTDFESLIHPNRITFQIQTPRKMN